MQIDIRRDDAEMLRDLLRRKVVELDVEINRTDRRAFKQELRQLLGRGEVGAVELDRAMERIVGELSTALEGGS
jgi:hypothetical protein